MKTKLLLPLLSLTLGVLPLLAELKYFPKDKAELLKLVKNEKIKLDEIDVSKITDMSYLFCQAIDDLSIARNYLPECGNAVRKDYKGIEKWDTSKVEDMSFMFWFNEKFNESIGSWNVGRVKNMDRMFASATSFNQPLDKWNVSNVEDMSRMFAGAKSFNQDLSSWDVRNVKDMSEMFNGASAWDYSVRKMCNLEWKKIK